MAASLKLEILKEQIRDRIDPEELLEYCGADRISHRFGEIRCTCPIHKGDGPLNFSWDTEKGVWTCWSRHCGENTNVGRDAFALVQLSKGVSFPRAIKLLGGLVGIDTDHAEFSKENYDELRIKRLIRRSANKEFEANPIQDEELLTLYGCGSHSPYLATRGFSEDSVIEFEVGYASEGEFKGRVVFAIRDHNGELIGFGGRQVSEDPALLDKYGKYKMMADFKKGVLYGLDKAKHFIDASEYPLPRSLVLVEGFLDRIRAWEYGGLNVVASLGTALTPEQVQLVVAHTSTVALAYDADAGGREGLARVYNALRPYCDLYVLPLPEGKDVGDLSFEEFWEVYTNPIKASRYF